MLKHVSKSKFAAFFLSLLLIVCFCASAEITRRDLLKQYQTGIDKIISGDYQGGIDVLTELGDYKESFSYIRIAKNQIAFEKAITLFDNGQIDDAMLIFSRLTSTDVVSIREEKSPEWYTKKIDEINDEIDKINKLQEENEKTYISAQEYLKRQEYLKALPLLESLSDFEDSDELLEECEANLARLKHSTTISAGISSSGGVTSDGHVFLSGKRVLQPSDVADWTDIISFSTMGSLAIGLKMDGTVVTAGSLDRDYRIETSNWDDIIAVSAGDLYIVGLRKNGLLVAQGYNNFGQMDVSDWHNIVAVSTGWRLTAGLDSAGEIYVAGYNAEKILADINANIDEWSDIVAISAGGGRVNTYGERGHVVALRKDGTVVAAGDNGKGQCNVQEWSNIIAISAGAYHTVGLTADGTVVTTQTDDGIRNEIASWNENKDIVAISAGYGFTLGLRSNGDVVGSGYYFDDIRNTDDWKDIARHLDEWNYIFAEN